MEITDACNPEEIVLKYNIKKAYTDNTLNKFSSLDEFKGIKRLNVFRFDKKQGMLLPVETQFDVENNQLYAEVNETGTYCLMDMEIWLDTLKIKIALDGNIELPTFCVADMVTYLSRFNQNGEYNFIVNDVAPRQYLPILSDPTMKNSDGDALDDSLDAEPLYHDPDPLSYSNILSVEIKYIPLQKVKSFTGRIGRKLAQNWDCDVYVSILKSCDCDDDIFLLTNEDQSLSEVFAITDELKKKLNNGDKEYSNSFGHVPNEKAAHTGKLETDQLVPEFFEKDSSYYYGCWYHNYCQEVKMYDHYMEQIGTNLNRTMQAFIVYNIATYALQNAILTSVENTYSVSQEEYVNTAGETINNSNQSSINNIQNTQEFELLKKSNFEKFTIKNKHLNSSGGNWSKFNVATEGDAHTLVENVLKNGTVKEISFNSVGTAGQRSFTAIIDAGKIIGTNGETSIVYVYDELGNVWTVFPKLN